MNNTELKLINDAIARATDPLAWNPIFADVISKGERVGHITSDGYSHKTWSFYPRSDIRRKGRGFPYHERQPGRREIRNRPIENVIPKWAQPSTIENVKTYKERTQ